MRSHASSCAADFGPQKCWASLDAFLAAVTSKKASGSVMEPAYPEQEDDWAESFADDGPRAFDAVRDDDDGDDD